MSPADTMAYRRAGYYGQYLGERYANLEEFAKKHNLPHRPFHLDANAGDVTMFDANFFHRAVSPKKDFRDVIQIYCLPNKISWEEQLQIDGDRIMQRQKNGYPNDPRRN